MSRFSLIRTIALLGLWCLHLCAQTGVIEEVRIESTNYGWIGPRAETRLVLRTNNRTLDRAKAAALTEALKAPLVPKPSLTNLNIT